MTSDKQKKVIVFTDLDGTLLNHDDYSYQDALPTLAVLRQDEIPLILISSKTAEEMQILHNELDLKFPFVCENGSLIVYPEGLESPAGTGEHRSDISGDYTCSCLGSDRLDILSQLAAFKLKFRFTGFSDMSVEEIAAHTGLSVASSTKAANRQFSEPIIWQDQAEKISEFENALSVCGLKVVKGGRFYHVMGQTDKSVAAKQLIGEYEKYYDAEIYSIGLGDSPNDMDMLLAVDLPIVIPAISGVHMQLYDDRDTIYAPFPGAKGWGAALKQALDQRLLNN